MRPKVRAIICFFVLELFVGFVLFLSGVGGFGKVLDVFRDFARLDFSLLTEEYFWGTFVVISSMLVLQAAFLTPIAIPTTRLGEKPGWVRMTISGHAIAITVLAPILYAALLFEEIRGTRVEGSLLRMVNDRPWVVLLAGTLAFGVPITIKMKRKWKDGIPVITSIRIAGLVCGLLIAGFVLWIMTMVEIFGGVSVDAYEHPALWILLCAPLVGWIVATPILIRFAKRSPGDGVLDRLAKFLFAGSIIELVAIIPFDVMMRRKSDCYCATTSFFSLIAAGSAGFIIFGPLVLLIVGRRNARLMRGRCRRCEYDMKGSPSSAKCPECGGTDHS